jgi:hypothetical protein
VPGGSGLQNILGAPSKLMGGFLPFPPPLPNHVAATALQLLPPAAFNALPAQAAVTKLLDHEILDAGVFEPFNPSDHPFGVPGLSLGQAVSGISSNYSPALDEIMDTIRAPQAWDINFGENAVVAVVDSGVNPRWVPTAQQVGGFAADGSDPWIDSQGHGSMVAGILTSTAPGVEVLSVKPSVSSDGNMSSMGTIVALDWIAQWALEHAQPVIANNSWGIFGVKNLILPCSVVWTRATRMLDEDGLVMTVWAAGNNREIAGDATFSGYCMNTTKWATSSGALTRDLKPQPYSSFGSQCYPLNPTVSAPTYGTLPWGSGFLDFEEQGGGTSSCAPMVAGTIAMMMTKYPGEHFKNYRAALRGAASNNKLGLFGAPYNPASGAGLLQADSSIRGVPGAQRQPSYWAEQTIPSSVPRLGNEPERPSG